MKAFPLVFGHNDRARAVRDMRVLLIHPSVKPIIFNSPAADWALHALLLFEIRHRMGGKRFFGVVRLTVKIAKDLGWRGSILQRIQDIREQEVVS